MNRKSVVFFRFWSCCHPVNGAMLLFLLLAVSCGSDEENQLKARQFALNASAKLAKCCSTTGEYKVEHNVLSIAKDKKRKQYKIGMEITWKEAKLLGANQVLKGILHVDLDGCNPHWEHDTGGIITSFSDCWKDCLFGCLDEK